MSRIDMAIEDLMAVRNMGVDKRPWIFDDNGNVKDNVIICDIIPWLEELKDYEIEFDEELADTIRENYESWDNSYNWCANTTNDIDYMLYKNYVLLKVHILGDIRGNYTEEILIEDCNIFELENVNQYKKLTENLVADICIFSEEYSVYDTNLREEIGCFCEIELEDLLEKIKK